jgi:hypothetical protein
MHLHLKLGWVHFLQVFTTIAFSRLQPFVVTSTNDRYRCKADIQGLFKFINYAVY